MKRNYTRREALKAGAKVGAAATFYGTLGGFAGNLYGKAAGYFGNKLYELDKKVDGSTSLRMAPVRGAKKVEDYRASIWQKVFGVSEKDRAENRQAYGVGDRQKNEEIIAAAEKESPQTRRSFIKSLLAYAGRNPTQAGAVAGVVYGVGKSLPGTISTARKNSQIRQLEDRVKDLEGQKTEEREQTLDDYTQPYNFLFLLGVSSMLFFSLISVSRFTGFVVAQSASEYNLLSLIFLCSGLLFLLAGTRGFKNKGRL